ncbi:hypothetical protein BD779DRAFT_637205 [Infundibulicybe gibba]|nr:hypothetical protein BD779DRAFT_637205 [Infundibulicybe gibba]
MRVYYHGAACGPGVVKSKKLIHPRHSGTMFAPYPIRYTYGPQYLARMRLGPILASPIHRVCSRRRHITTRIEQNVGSGLGLLPSEYPLDTQTKSKPVKWRAPTVSSLNPQRLLPSDFLDLSGKSWQSIRTASTPPHPLQVAPLRYVSRRSPDIGYLVHDPFPPGTHGFLYYHSPPNLAPTAGEIRFRITHTNDPSSFRQALIYFYTLAPLGASLSLLYQGTPDIPLFVHSC